MNLKRLKSQSQPLIITLVILILMLALPFLVFQHQFFHSSKPTPVYLTIKLNQGYWWVNTPSPPLTFIEAIKSQLTAYNFLGHPTAQIIAKHIYPTFSNNTLKPIFNTYIDLKIYTPKITKSEIFFDRQRVAIGEPLEVKFPHLTLSGSIINLSPTPTQPRLQTYQITLKKLVYPWEYQQLQIPTSYFDGQTKVFEITSKHCDPAIIITKDRYNQLLKKTDQNTCYLTLQGIIKLEQHHSTLTFGPEIPIAQGLQVFLPLEHTYLTDFTVTHLSLLHQQDSQSKK